MLFRGMMAAHATSLGLLDGIVELDERHLGGKPRFRQGVVPGAKHQKSLYSRGWQPQGPCPVRGSLIPGDSYAVLAPYIKLVVSPKTCVMTDELQSYVAIGKQFASHRHLPRYISEVAFRWNNRDPFEKKRNGFLDA